MLYKLVIVVLKYSPLIFVSFCLIYILYNDLAFYIKNMFYNIPLTVSMIYTVYHILFNKYCDNFSFFQLIKYIKNNFLFFFISFVFLLFISYIIRSYFLSIIVNKSIFLFLAYYYYILFSTLIYVVYVSKVIISILIIFLYKKNPLNINNFYNIDLSLKNAIIHINKKTIILFFIFLTLGLLVKYILILSIFAIYPLSLKYNLTKLPQMTNKNMIKSMMPFNALIGSTMDLD